MDATMAKLSPSPRDSANILSKAFFIWSLPLFRKGLSKVLEMTDLYKPIQGDDSAKLGDRLEIHWNRQLKKKNPSLFRALFYTLKWQVTFLIVLVVINEFFIKTIMPLLLGMLLEYFSPDSTMPRSEAFWYAGAVVFLTFLSSFLSNHYMLSAYHLGMRARVAVCSLVYRKSLRLSRTALGESAPGKVVNLLSNDVNRFDFSAFFFNYLWAAPLSAVIVMILLFREIGVSGIFGVLVIFSAVPFQAYTGKLASKFRLQTAIRTDERVRLMDEIVSGVQVIKMYAWEKPFAQLINAARKSELKVVLKITYVRAVFMTFVIFTTRAATFFTMMSMVLMGNTLTASQVFMFAQFYSSLSMTMSSMFARAVAEVAEGRVSLRRLENYLHHDEFIVRAVSNHETIDKSKYITIIKLNGDTPELASLENGNLKSNIPSNQEDYAVKMCEVSSRWGHEGETILKDIMLRIKKGKLIGVIGPVGSGKSSLLQLILGEMNTVEITGKKNTINIQGSMSYACQEPWVFGGSVKQNILFGLPFDKTRYNDVIRVCALRRDLQLFPHGDETLVGDRGASLSGGQKARINLARAVYRQADIYLLDDPLSAVDAAVGRQLFDTCISNYLRKRTRILVTHQLHHLKGADHIIVLMDGKITTQGSFAEVSESSTDFAKLLVSKEEHEEVEEDLITEDEELPREKTRAGSIINVRQFNRSISTVSQRTQRSESITSSILELTEPAYEEGHNTRQTLAAEAISKGAVDGSVFGHYLKAGGGCCFLFTIFVLYALTQVIASGFDYFVSYWTSQETLRVYYNSLNSSAVSAYNGSEGIFNQSLVENVTMTPLIFDSQNGNMNLESAGAAPILPPLESLLSSHWCMSIHGAMVLSLLIVALTRSFVFFNMCIKASFILHNLMFRGVVRSPMKFFDHNPSGRIINRFSKDVGSVDELLPKALMDASQVILNMVGVIVVAAIVNPMFLAVLAVLSIIFWFMRKGYLKTSKAVKRLEGVARSPVYTHLNATLQGLPTIRAHKAQAVLTTEFDTIQNGHTSAWYTYIASSAAFGLALDLLCVIFVAIVTFSFLLMPAGFFGDKVGLAITQAMGMTFLLQWGIRQSAEVENQLMAVERVVEYTQLPAENGVEPDDVDRRRVGRKPLKSHKQPPRDWPEHGKIVFDNLALKYSDDPDASDVLKGLNFTIKSKQKVGIVGRTGAGKSSLIQALFRLAYNSGLIQIDGVDTSEISLENLRQKISIIPQDPMLFSGTIRKNLDPFDEYSDQMLWEALEEVELKESIVSGGAGLAGRVLDGGSNFSVGQKQLVCLARALLRKNTILLMDEATANVDPHTDALIQQTIRIKFADCTVLTIAHRLNTIIDSDLVIVMDAGVVAEIGPPDELLKNPEGHFTSMLNETKQSKSKNTKNTPKNK